MSENGDLNGQARRRGTLRQQLDEALTVIGEQSLEIADLKSRLSLIDQWHRPELHRRTAEGETVWGTGAVCADCGGLDPCRSRKLAMGIPLDAILVQVIHQAPNGASDLPLVAGWVSNR